MALRYILRPDGSSNHMVDFDPETGEYKDNPGGQGYESGSSWSRGQSWAIYGMALAYRYTKNQAYLDAAKRSAHYFMANVSLNDYIPFLISGRRRSRFILTLLPEPVRPAAF